MNQEVELINNKVTETLREYEIDDLVQYYFEEYYSIRKNIYKQCKISIEGDYLLIWSPVSFRDVAKVSGYIENNIFKILDILNELDRLDDEKTRECYIIGLKDNYNGYPYDVEGRIREVLKPSLEVCATMIDYFGKVDYNGRYVEEVIGNNLDAPTDIFWNYHFDLNEHMMPYKEYIGLKDEHYSEYTKLISNIIKEFYEEYDKTSKSPKMNNGFNMKELELKYKIDMKKTVFSIIK